MSGTDLAYATTRTKHLQGVVDSAERRLAEGVGPYALSTGCPVLTSGMAVPGSGGATERDP
eukprot:2063889-Rhodomonas_salina.4